MLCRCDGECDGERPGVTGVPGWHEGVGIHSSGFLFLLLPSGLSSA
jgi:hypothetical protein